jgi:hypothetical protein
MNRRPVIHRFALAVAVVLTLASCSDDKAAPPQAPVAWTKVDLPAEPVLLTAHGSELLIGLRARGAKVVPRLLIQQADGHRREIKLEPKSLHGFDATWRSIAYDGSRILAIGGVPSGAHSNIRWTVWSGSSTTLTEYPQEFNTFGGQTAGPLYAALITPAGEALGGAWGSAETGLDGAIWLKQGDSSKWIRQDSAKTALQSVPSLLVGPNYGTVAGSSLVLVGSQVRLAPNVVQQAAAVWRSTSLNSGWSRVALPEPGNRSQANAATCTEKVCTISGFADGKLAIWQLEGSQGQRLGGVPAIAVGDKDKVVPPLDVDGRLYQVVAEGNKVKVVSGHDGSWTVQESTGPEGVVTAAAVIGKTLYLLAGPADRPASLWKTTIS